MLTKVIDFALANRFLVFLGTVVATVWMFRDIPKGFFPEEDIGQIQVSTEAAEDVSASTCCVPGTRRAAGKPPTKKVEKRSQPQ